MNAAVLNPMGKIASSDVGIDDWKSHFDINFFSLITALRATLPALRESDLGGRVVFVSSGAATGNVAGWGPYNASKAAMNSLCRYVFRLSRMLSATSSTSCVSVAQLPRKNLRSHLWRCVQERSIRLYVSLRSRSILQCH